MANENLLLFDRQQQAILSDLLGSMARTLGSNGVEVKWTPGAGLSIAGTMKRQRQRRPAPRSVRMRIKEVFNDYLRCRVWDGAAENSADILVAKPFKLRHVAGNYPNVSALTTVNALEVNVTVSGNSETWELPTEVTYTVDDEIYADRVGGTGVVDGSGDPIIWQDCNVDGRHWILKG